MINQKVNVVLTDTLVKIDWEFAVGLKSVTNDDWKIKSWDNAGIMQKKFDNIKRYWGYISHSFNVFLKRKRYHNIVSWQQFYGLFISFFCRLFKVRKKFHLIIITFIYKEKKGLVGKIYKKFIKYAITSSYVDFCVVFSQYEVKYYSKLFGTKEDKFVFFPLGIESGLLTENTEYKIDKPYLLSVGRSNRDYVFLLNMMKEDVQHNLVIITDSIKNKEQYENEHVLIFDNIRGDEYLKILKDCFCVLIPLADKSISSGQLVMLQAMQYMKPIIVTESDTISDYVENNFNAIVCKKNKKDFLNAIDRVYSDNGLYQKLVENGKKSFDEKHSLFALGKNIGRYLWKLQ